MTLSCLVMFKEQLPSPSHNTPTSTFLMFIGGTTFSQSLHSPYIIKHICKFPCSIALFQGGTSQLLTKTCSYLIFMKYNRSLITNALKHEGNNSYNSSFFKNTSFLWKFANLINSHKHGRNYLLYSLGKFPPNKELIFHFIRTHSSMFI